MRSGPLFLFLRSGSHGFGVFFFWAFFFETFFAFFVSGDLNGVPGIMAHDVERRTKGDRGRCVKESDQDRERTVFLSKRLTAFPAEPLPSKEISCREIQNADRQRDEK